MLEELEERRMEDLERDMFGYDDDLGYYDVNDDSSTNAADGAFCLEALDSCWISLDKAHGSTGIVSADPEL